MKLAALTAQTERQISDQALISLIPGEALYPDDADEAKMLLMIAERRMDQQLTTHTESIRTRRHQLQKNKRRR